MFRNLSFLAVVAGFAIAAAPVRAQDAQSAQPSVADAARQARKDKDKNADKTAAAPKTVITEDNISGGTAAGKPGDPAGMAGATGSGKSNSIEAQRARLAANETALDRLEPLGRTELATLVLKGNAANFPGRAQWEERLYVAKEQYVLRARQLIGAAKQALADVEALQSSDPKITLDDPRVQALAAKVQQIKELSEHTESSFQQVMKEGENLAAASTPAK